MRETASSHGHGTETRGNREQHKQDNRDISFETTGDGPAIDEPHSAARSIDSPQFVPRLLTGSPIRDTMSSYTPRPHLQSSRPPAGNLGTKQGPKP